jgi:hypothetical protein
MTKQIYALALVVLCAACGDNSGRNNGAPVHPTRGKPANPDTKPTPNPSINATWIVKSKTCGEKPLPLTKGERLILSNGRLEHAGLKSEDQTQDCTLYRTYTRKVLSYRREGGEYTEKASLTPGALRLTCTKKNSETVLSNHSDPWEGSARGFVFKTAGKTGVAYVNDEDCASGLIEMEVARKDGTPLADDVAHDAVRNAADDFAESLSAEEALPVESDSPF